MDVDEPDPDRSSSEESAESYDEPDDSSDPDYEP